MIFVFPIFVVESQKYLTYYQAINKHFVETSSYQTGEKVFEKYGIVIWTGRSGSGKTLAAIRLILKHKNTPDLVFRKIRCFEELSYIEPDSKQGRKTLIFIDNIFFSQSMKSDLPSWWEKLNNVYKTYFQLQELEEPSYPVRFVITARENVLERVCTYMGPITPILNENFRINANNLSADEKKNIIDRQIAFAKQERNLLLIPKMDEDFKKKVIQSEGPIGFPLCAHLFVCSDRYQKSGVHFFSCPIEYLKRQINDEIERDTSNRTKSLLFVLFFHEWFTKLGHSEKLYLKSDYQCKRFLDIISKDLRTNFEPFDFKELLPEAQRLVGMFLKEEGESSFKFVHDSVYEAVGAWFCETYIIQTAKHFPLEIIQNEVYEDLKENTQAQIVLATRLLYETLNQRISQVFASKCFQHESFCACFLKELKKKDDKTVIEFLTATNESSSVKLSCIFWTSWNKMAHLTEQLYDLVKDKYSNSKSELRLYASLHEETFVDLSPEYHLYVALYGECCARKEGLLLTVNGKLRNDFNEIKNRVLNFVDEDENTILHIIITSENTDRFASVVVEKLLKSKMSVDVRNKSNATPLMLAVCQTNKRTDVINKLMEFNPKLHLKDQRSSSVFHYCLSSCNDDETCAKYLNIVLQGENAEKYLAKDDSNCNTPLCTAAMETKYSRILSIWTILDAGNYQILNTINEDGLSPLHLSINSMNKSTSTYAELECCVRVILLLLFGGCLDDNPDTTYIITECKYEHLKNILEKPKDEENMVCILDRILEKSAECKDLVVPVQYFSNKIETNIATQISKAAEILKNLRLE